MLTADQQKHGYSAAAGDAAETGPQTDLGETLLRTAFPKLGAYADNQMWAAAAREAAADKERRDRIAALPFATLQVSVTGHVTAMWAGRLHCSWQDLEPGEPDPNDPYADRPTASLELIAEDTARPNIGGLMLTRWAFQLP